jgi:Cof subfamily protein (haloacid dehalogenase superfamily)
MGKIKLIVTDLDGTFTGERGAILEENLKAVKAAQENGIMICACSARLWAMGRHLVEKCGFDRFAIFNGGASVVDCPNGKHIYRNGLPREYFKELLTASISFGVPVQSWNHDFIGMYSPTMGERGLSMLQRYTNPDTLMHCEMRVYDTIDNMDAGCRDVANQILIFSGAEYLEPVREKVLKICDVEVTCSSAYCVDITAPGATKGGAIEKLAEHLGLGKENIMAIGDSLSDIDMFRTSGLTVAVENAVDGLKNAAQHVVAKNVDFGFAQAVYDLAIKS